MYPSCPASQPVTITAKTGSTRSTTSIRPRPPWRCRVVLEFPLYRNPVDPSAEVGVVVKPAFCSNGRRDGLSGAALPFTGKVHYAALVSGEKPWLSAISRRSTIPNPDWLRWALIYVHPL